MARLPALCAVLALAACGGGRAGATTVSGAVAGYALSSVAEAGSASYTGAGCDAANPYEAALFIYLSSSPGVCAAYQGGGAQPPGNSIVISVFTFGATPQAAIGPGTYLVSLAASPYMLAGIGPNGCGADGDLAGSGTVTIASAGSSGVSGSYDLSFIDSTGNPAGRLSGTFTAASCAVGNFCSASRSSC